jgi:hypothetical protein
LSPNVGDVFLYDRARMRGKGELNRLAWDFVKAVTARFTHIGIWPRPPASRKLEAGRDFVYPDVQPMPQCEALTSFLGSWEEQIGTSPMDIAVNLALSVLANSTEGDPDQAICRRAVDLLWSELGRKTGLLREVVELEGLRLETDQLSLDSKTKVLRLDWDYPRSLLNNRWRGVSAGPYVNSAFVYEERRSKKRGWSHLFYDSRLDALLAAMRIYSPGVVRPGYRFSLHVAEFPMSQPFAWHSREFGDGLTTGELPCRLDANDVTRLESLWRRIYYDHLSPPYEEASSLYKHVNALYSIRSYIVHGRTLDDKELETNLSKLVGKKADPLQGWWSLAPEAVRRARMIVRRGLLGAIECFGRPQTEATWPLPDDFDRQIASPTGKQRWQAAFEVPLQEWLPHYVEAPDDPWYP